MTGFKDEILSWIGNRIRSSDDFFLPLKMLHKEVGDGVSLPLPSLEVLQKWLSADDRFDIFESPPTLGKHPSVPETDMEKLGFYTGPRVGLKSKRPLPEQILNKLREHADQLITSLQKAYQTRPKEGLCSEVTEDKLLELLQQAKDLKEKLPDSLDHETTV